MASLLSPAIACLLFLTGVPMITAQATPEISVLYQNDGNWTNHENIPSALLILEPASYDTALRTCQSYGERLLNCRDLNQFSKQISYQQYLGTLGQNTEFWSSCSDANPVHWSTLTSHTISGSNAGKYPYICTNSAPLVKAVDTDYSVFPRVNKTFNGTTFEGVRDHMGFRFMGIPFAEPPVGALRFRNAQPTRKSYVNATKFGTGCLQYGWFDGNDEGLNPWGNSEDCLYLNVYTPHIPNSRNTSSTPLKPVMFWMHGGGQTTGTGSDSTFDGASLVSRSDVVLVTINYRLNIFGYLSLDDTIPGNFALTDKIAALHWVKSYIAGFGGDPDNITIFGQSAGGGSVIDLLTSPNSSGLYDKAIIQSGGRGHTWETQTEARDYIEPYISPYCNNTGAARLKCLQKLPDSVLLNITNSATTWQSAVDNDLVIDIPISQVAKGAEYINSVKMLTGFMPEEAQSLLEDYVPANVSDFDYVLSGFANASILSEDQANAIKNSNLWLVTNETFHNGSTSYPNAYNASVSVATQAEISCFGASFTNVAANVYAYQSLWVYTLERGYGLNYFNYYNMCTFPVGHPQPYYRCHSSDLYEVFGTYYLFDLPVREPEDIGFTNAIQDMWGSFARTGDPNVEKTYLQARGYSTTLQFFENWEWPQFTSWEPKVASIQFPQPGFTSLPNQEQCAVIMPFATL